ncbi:MAG: S8 family serine peptidase [Geminicoccaceae bacterium]
MASSPRNRSGLPCNRLDHCPLETRTCQQRSLRAVRGDAALAAGATGEGVVALVDSGVTSITAQAERWIRPTSTTTSTLPVQRSATIVWWPVVAGTTSITETGSPRGSCRNAMAMIVGIAPDARLMSLDADQSCGASCFRADDTAAAVRHAAANGADVINLSQGSSDLAGFPIASLVEATGQDVVIAAAAGNTGGSLIYPAAYAGDSRLGGKLVAVGSVSADLTLAASSSRPATPEQAEFYLVAGTRCEVTTNTAGELQRVNGTSFATPLVSGAVKAVLKARSLS